MDGLDVVKQAQEVRRRINMVSGGETSGYGILTVRENLWMFSQFYGVTWSDANDAHRSRCSKLSSWRTSATPW